MNKYWKIFLLMSAGTILGFLCFNLFKNIKSWNDFSCFIDNSKNICYETKLIEINKNVIKARVADSPEKQSIGLSNINSLPNDQAMMFVFDRSGFYQFWTKNMKFALDFVWINDGKIVQITKNIRPEDYQPPNELIPNQKVDMVLEVSANTADRLNLKIGDNVVEK